MRLIKTEELGWKGKLEGWSLMHLQRWEDGSERPPQMLNGFISTSANIQNDQDLRHKLEALGVLLYSMGSSGINTADFPYSNLQAICELKFVKSVSLAKALKKAHSREHNYEPALKKVHNEPRT